MVDLGELLQVLTDDERDVELTIHQLHHRVFDVVVLEAADGEAGHLGEDRADHRRQDLHRHALERADDQPAAAGEQGFDIVLGLPQAGEDHARVVEQRRPHRGQLDLAGAAGSIEQLMADDAFERGNLLADRRLAEPQPLGGAAEGAFGGDCLQCLEVSDLDVAEMDRLHK